MKLEYDTTRICVKGIHLVSSRSGGEFEVCLLDNDHMAVIFDALPAPYLTPFSGLNDPIDLDERIFNRKFGRSPAITQTACLEELAEFDKIIRQGEWDLRHAHRGWNVGS